MSRPPALLPMPPARIALAGLWLAAGCAGRSTAEVPAGLGASPAETRTEAMADTSRRGLQATPVPMASDDVDLSEPSPPAPPLPGGFVYLREAAPEVAQEMRYRTAFNFVGEPVDGYRAPVCILTAEAARALARVDADLARRDLGLKVYDCYRPQMAVDHFVRWARSGDETMKRGFYPDEPTATLFRRGYIATRSGHTRGSTVDLTLVRRPAAAAVVTQYPDPAAGPLPRCDRDRPERFDDGDLDMGTAYDCLSTRAATAFAGVPAEARRNRETLRAAMARHGFRNYSKEWWHFTLRGEPFPRTYHTFPVE